MFLVSSITFSIELERDEGGLVRECLAVESRKMALGGICSDPELWLGRPFPDPESLGRRFIIPRKKESIFSLGRFLLPRNDKS